MHISTDYVFAGDATTPYAEDAAPAPRSAYGRTKLAGEVAVRAALPDRGFIVRTAWLYGVHGANFVKTMLALEATKPEISVVDDQRGQPTWSRDLARQIVALVGSRRPRRDLPRHVVGRDHVVRVHPGDLPADRGRPRSGSTPRRPTPSPARRRDRPTASWATIGGPPSGLPDPRLA